MGCDIHLYVERKDDTGQWVTADTWEQDEYGEDRLSVRYDNRYYTGRNYNLFAMLADVRNGFGFAGTPINKPVVPLAAPRGLPEDVTEPVKAESDRWGVDGHSHSWFTVAELMAYDWTQTITHIGVVGAATFYAWEGWAREKGESPKDWCGDISGLNVRKISEDEMRALVKSYESHERQRHQTVALLAQRESHTYCRVSWSQPYYKPASEFLGQVLPRLWRLGKPEDVRIVFWFDN